MIGMPGESYDGPLPALDEAQAALAEELRRDVTALVEGIGERNVEHPSQLEAAARFIERELRRAGLEPRRQSYTVEGVACHNIEAEIAGGANAARIVVIGGHYDSVLGSPGANDNASAVAALLAMARRFVHADPGLTLRLVFFVNEEPPRFHSEQMGSHVYARRCRERGEDIAAMLSFDGLGYYADEPGSQQLPPPFDAVYPNTGDFIAFVGNIDSAPLVKRCVGAFRDHARFPSQGGAAPAFLPGVAWSDHAAFWRHGYEGVMVTDTLPFRYPHYHQPSDTPDQLDYDRMTRVVDGLIAVVRVLAEIESDE